MATFVSSLILLSLTKSIYASPYTAEITVTETNTRTIYTCPCDSTTYFAQTSPAFPQPSAWVSRYSTSSSGGSTTSEQATGSGFYTSNLVSISQTLSRTSQQDTIVSSGQTSSAGVTSSSSSSQSFASSPTSASSIISASSTSSISSQSVGTTSPAVSSSSSTQPTRSDSTSLAQSTISTILTESTNKASSSNEVIASSTTSSTSSSVTSIASASTSSSSTISSTTTSSAPSNTPFSVQISVNAQPGKRAGSSIGFLNGQAVVVSDASSAYAFAITSDGSLIVYGTTTTIGTLRDDGTRILQQVLPADGTNALLTGWTLTAGSLTYPSVTFCLSSTNELQAAFGIPTSDCNRVALTGDTSPDSFNLALSQTITTTSTTMTTSSPKPSSSCIVDVAGADIPCTPGRIYQQNGVIFQEYCDVTIQSLGGPPTSDFEARSYDTCSAICARSPSCDGFGAALTNPPSANSGPCIMFSGIRFSPSTTTGSGYRAGKKLSAAPCGASATYITTSSTSATSTGPVRVAVPTATSCSPRFPYPEDNCNAGALYYYSNVTPQLYSATGCLVNITGTPLQKTTEVGWDDCAKKCMTVDACESYMFTRFNPFLMFGSGYCNLFDTKSNFIGTRNPGWAGVKLRTLPAGCS